MSWDIFCTVIDNFGDIGVTWRLARQLAVEHRVAVRLWVDDLAAFRRIRPEIDPALDRQTLSGVTVRHWRTPLPEVEPGAVVIEALACNLPEAFIRRMAARTPPPVWLNLEYLTAEDWADGVHGLPSPHPRLPLVKYFYVPGFTAHTGGLTREADLARQRTAFQRNPARQAAFWHSLGLPPPAGEAQRISLFSYHNAALPALLTALAAGPRPVGLVVPEGLAVPQIEQWLGRRLAVGAPLQRGQLGLHRLPMLDQDRYDRLLWACDLNLVRGEDSFLRAQFAARPLLWQAYRQPEQAHFDKLAAFLKRYTAAQAPALAQATRQLALAWNQEADVRAAWQAWWDERHAHTAHARAWCAELEAMPDLAAKLMIFCEKVMKPG